MPAPLHPPLPFPEGCGWLKFARRRNGGGRCTMGDPGYGRHSKCVQKTNHNERRGSFSSFLHSFHPTDRPSTQRQQTRATTFVVVCFGYTTLISSYRPPPFLTPAYIERPSLQATFETVYHPSPAPPPPPRLYYGLKTTPITFDDIEMGSTMVRRV